MVLAFELLAKFVIKSVAEIEVFPLPLLDDVLVGVPKVISLTLLN